MVVEAIIPSPVRQHVDEFAGLVSVRHHWRSHQMYKIYDQLSPQ
jgi:hypothetical protein